MAAAAVADMMIRERPEEAEVVGEDADEEVEEAD